MIEQRSAEIRVTDLRELLRLGHRRVRALRDECVEDSDSAFRQELAGGRKEFVRVIVARLVRDDGEDALTGLDDVEGLFDCGRQDYRIFKINKIDSDTVCSAQNWNSRCLWI